MKRSRKFYETLNKIKSHIPRDVILQGSRSKLPETKTEASDWDLAVQYDEALDDWLSMHGWDILCEPDYCDDNTAIIYEKVIDGEHVQLSLRHDITAFDKLWNTITPEFFEEFLWKSPRQEKMKWFNSQYENFHF